MDDVPTSAEAYRTKLRAELIGWCRQVLAPQDIRPAKHHILMLERLSDLASTESGRLMLLMPPGSAKSTYASQLFPAWWLSRRPHSSVIGASHTAALAAHFGRRVRSTLAMSEAGLSVALREDPRMAGLFATRQGGEYFGIGLGGAVTGRRADLAIIDDPVASFEDGQSKAARDRVWDWFRSDLVSRLKPGGRMVLAMARWHPDDLAGRLMVEPGWDVLCLPALAQQHDVLGRHEGEALWPEWETEQSLREKRKLIGERNFMALFQQAPLHEAAQVFQTDKIVILEETPPGSAVRGWDLAATANRRGDADYTVGIKLVRHASGFTIDDVVRLQAEPSRVYEAILRTAEVDGKSVPIGLPIDPGQAGKWQAQYIARSLSGYVVHSSPESGSKEARARPVASQVNCGNFSARRAPWTQTLLEELALFPGEAKDDQVDALSRAFSLMTEPPVQARYTNLPFLGR